MPRKRHTLENIKSKWWWTQSDANPSPEKFCMAIIHGHETTSELAPCVVACIGAGGYESEITSDESSEQRAPWLLNQRP